MSEARLLVGNVFDRIRDIEPGSVDLVMTSPPFLALRDYLPSDHADKASELGQEATPGEYIQNQLGVVAAVGDVLAPHGSICWEIGDTYSGSGGSGGDYDDGGLRDGQPRATGSAHKANTKRYAQGHQKDGRDPSLPSAASDMQVRNSGGPGWPLNKSLCGIPTLFAWSLAYGRNLLTGEPSPAGSWMIRNVVVWWRPNPPVGQLADKFRPSTSYLTIATRARDRYFDLDAVRIPNRSENVRHLSPDNKLNGRPGDVDVGGTPPTDHWEPWPIEAALWDWWEQDIWKVTTAGYPGSHYAVFPPSLCVRPIKAMCPERVCRTCGKPSSRIVESTRYDTNGEVLDFDFTKGDRSRGLRQTNTSDGGPRFDRVERVEKGWTDCGHDDWRPGCVLDPFAGSGTTLAVATGHGRDAIGIDLDERNAALCRERIGMFLTDIVYPLKDVPPVDTDAPIVAEGMF